MKEKNIWKKILIGLKNIFAGIIIGISNVIPGVSGGTMAVVLNVYDELIDAVSIKRFVKHLFFLITLGLGMIIGIKAFSEIIEVLFAKYPMQTNFTFLGLILGSIPMIFKRSLKERFRPMSLIPFAAALALMIVLFIFGNGDKTGSLITDVNFGSVMLFVLAGFVAAFAMVLPGISGSMIMVIIGAYTTVIAAVSNMTWSVLIPFGIGAVIGAIACLKLVKLLMARYYQATYFAILGLILGSLPSLYPGFSFDMQGLISILLMLAAGAVAFLFARSENDSSDIDSTENAAPLEANDAAEQPHDDK